MKYVAFPDQQAGTVSFPLASCGSVDPSLVSTLRASELTCFLAYEVMNDGEKPTDIQVSIQKMTSLADRLKEPVTARDVTVLFRHLHNLIEACAYHGLPFMNVVLDARYIYANSLEDELKFVYLPVSGKVRGIALIKEFFLDLGVLLEPKDAQARELIQSFSDALEENDPLNLMELSASLGNLAKTPIPNDLGSEHPAVEEPPQGENPTEQDSSPGATTVLEPEALSPAAVREEAASEPEPEPEPEPDPEPEPEPKPEPEPAFTSEPDPEPEKPWASGRHVREDPGTSVLNAVDIKELMTAEASLPVFAEEDEATVEEAPLPRIPDRYRLVHERSGNATDISGSRFTVGKSKHADFQVLNTTTVSRIHALFSCGDDACSLKDNRSLNGTFVNERRIGPEEEVRLESGDIIRMSDEEFSFEVISQGSREVTR